jgi:hypothetical protein
LKRTFEPSAFVPRSRTRGTWTATLPIPPFGRLLRNRLSGNGHDLALRQKPVPHKTLAALVVQKVDVTCHEFQHFRAHSRRQKLLRTRTQKIRQRFNNAMICRQFGPSPTFGYNSL